MTTLCLVLMGCLQPNESALADAPAETENTSAHKGLLKDTTHRRAPKHDSIKLKRGERKAMKIKENTPPVEIKAETIGDEILNGKVLKQTIILSKKTGMEHPDTLQKLAVEAYKNHEHLFPRAIADDFENGKSVEKIAFPEYLIFAFELFENKAASKAYAIQKITVRRERNGKLNAE